MYNRYNKFDMAHAFAANLFLGHFHTATIAHNAFVTDTFILTAITFVVLVGPKMRSQKSPSRSGL